MPIETIGSIKIFLAYYGEITLSYIKAQEQITNATNDSRDQEDEQLYT